MKKRIKKFTEFQITQRAKIERKLSEIQAISLTARNLMTTRGFIDYFLDMRNLYNTQLEAYERLEDFHTAITGHRKYSEFNSFRVIFNRTIYGRN